MSAAFEFISNNALVSALVATLIVAVIAAIWKRRRDSTDSETIYRFLLQSKSATDFTFRSTEAISSHTKIPEHRVAELCSLHPKVRRNEKEKKSWRVVE